jgi:hypothetical protein
MMHGTYVPNSMWSCAVIIIVYLCNRTSSRAIGVLVTLLTSKVPDASKFRVVGCIAFTNVLDKLRRKLGEKAFRGVIVGYPHDAPWYCVSNRVTCRNTASAHVVFQEDVP